MSLSDALKSLAKTVKFPVEYFSLVGSVKGLIREYKVVRTKMEVLKKAIGEEKNPEVKKILEAELAEVERDVIRLRTELAKIKELMEGVEL